MNEQAIRNWWKVEADYPKDQHIAQLEKETLCIMMQEHFEQLFDI